MILKDSDLYQTPPDMVELVVLACPRGYVDLFGAIGSPLSNAARAIVTKEADAFNPETKTPVIDIVANPPWSHGWVAACVREMKRRAIMNGQRRVLIAPMRLDTAWARDFSPDWILVPCGRVNYLDGATGKPAVIIDSKTGKERPGSPHTSSCVYLHGTLTAAASLWLDDHGWTKWKRHAQAD